MFNFGKKKSKKEKKTGKAEKHGVKPWDEGKARNSEYRRTTGSDSSAILEAQRMRRGGSTPSHYLRKRKR